MSPLYLECALCGRKQADGLLSRGAWGHVQLVNGSLSACAGCKGTNADWEERLRGVGTPPDAPSSNSAFGVAQRPASG